MQTVHANAFLVNLAMVLCVAAATTVVFQRLRQPLVLGYIIAGLLVGRVRVDPGSPAIGRTLAELNLRGATGATVLAILRGGDRILVPTGHEQLHEGDALALAGTHECVAAARVLISTGAAPGDAGLPG